MLEDLYRWDRDEKLFAIRVLKPIEPARRERLLLQLVVDEDPVVRGKAALALEGCGDDVLLEAAETLIDQEGPETSILAAELLGFVREAEPEDLLAGLIESDDERVVKAAVGALEALAPSAQSRLLKAVLDDYDPGYDTALERLFAGTNDPEMLPALKRWHGAAAPPRRALALAFAAGWDHPVARRWVRERLEADPGGEPNDRQRRLIRWILGEEDGPAA